MSEATLLACFRWAFVLFIAISSAQTIADAGSGGPHSHVLYLATVEIVAALLLSFSRTRSIAAGLLVMVFAIAFVLVAASGAFAIRFPFFAVTAVYIALAERALERRCV